MRKNRRSHATIARRRTRCATWLALLALLAGTVSCEDCFRNVGKGAAEEASKSVDNFVNNMPAILDQIDQLLENNIDAIGDTLAQQIQEVNRLLRQNIDGINAALQGTIDNVDAMLAARMDQLFRFARAFLQDINDIVAKRVDQLTHNAQELIKTVETSGVELIEAAGFQVVRTIREGNRVVAVVIGGVVETVILVVSGLVMFATVILAGVFFIRRFRMQPQDRSDLPGWQLGLGSGFFGLVFTVGALMIFVPSVRASVASSRVDLGEDKTCSEVLPLAGSFVGRHAGTAPGGLSEDDQERAESLLSGLFECQISGTTSQLRSEALARAGDIQRLLGIASEWCRRNEQCDAGKGERCDAALGLCTTRCTRNQHCASGELCHGPDTVGVCAAACSRDADCPVAGLACGTGGVCTPKGGDGGTPGGGTSGGGGPGSPGKIFIPRGFLPAIIFDKPVPKCPGPACDPRPDRPGLDVTFPLDRVLDPRIRIDGARTFRLRDVPTAAPPVAPGASTPVAPGAATPVAPGAEAPVREGVNPAIREGVNPRLREGAERFRNLGPR